jgi:hypothetical protein
VARLAAKAVGWVKGKVKSGVDFLKKKAKAGVAKVKEKVGGIFGRRDQRSATERKAALEGAMGQAQSVLQDEKTTVIDVQKELPRIKSRYNVKELKLVVDEAGSEQEIVHVVGANSPRVAGSPMVKPIRVVQRAEDADVPPMSTATQQKWVINEVELRNLVADAYVARDQAVTAHNGFVAQKETVDPTFAEAIKNKAVAWARGVTTHSWEEGIAQIKDPQNLTPAEADWVTRRLGVEASLWEQGAEDQRRGLLDAALTPREQPAGAAPTPSPTRTLPGQFQVPPKQEPGEAYRLRRAGAFDIESAKAERKELAAPGLYQAKHAEKQAYQLTSSPSVGVSKEMCDQCQGFFVNQAINAKKILVVADPVRARVFLPDGSMMSR